MKIKTAELTGHALDWVVIYAQCLEATEGKPILARDLADIALRNGAASATTDWSKGGPIIEREGITLSKTAHGFWEAYKRPSIPADFYHVADMPLIAAMRCFVASKLGDEVDVPEELCTP